MVNGGKPQTRKLHVAEIDGHMFTIKYFCLWLSLLF